MAKMNRTIESPGIETREVDLTLRASLPVGTNVFVQGFADTGPTDELINVTSVSELEQIYGTPTNAAERYFYHTSKQVLESPGNLLTNRLPYGLSGGGGYSSDYSALLFPVTLTTIATGGTPSGTSTFNDCSAYNIGKPVQFKITDAEYLAWDSGQISWTNTPNAASVSAVGSIKNYTTIGNAGIIVINKLKTTVDNYYGGYYVGLADNTGLTDTTYNSISTIQYNTGASVSAWNAVPSTMIETSLSGTIISDSISEDFETIPQTPIDGVTDSDMVILGLFRLLEGSTSSQAGIALQAVLKEGFAASLDADRNYSPNGTPDSQFIGNIVNGNSTFMRVLVNPNFATQTSWSPGTVPKKVVTTSVDNLYALGPKVDPTTTTTRAIGNLPTKLARSLVLAENKEQIPIDIVCDGGLSTVWTVVANYQDSGNDSTNYDDTTFFRDISALESQTTGSTSTPKNNWVTIYNQLNTFCETTRKDCLLIADPLKNVFVQNTLKTLDDTTKDFSSNIYWPLKNLLGSSTSNYSCAYGNWVKVYDPNLGAFTWLPFSGYQAAIMCKMDAALQPWYAPAGLNNGIIRNISDIAINPTQKQRDLLYRISVNPTVYFPGDGYTVWGQKTLQKKPTAFDRINVRRLFLVLEKATNAVMRYFVFEPNTVFTRTRVSNVLSPIFEIAKNNEGVYDYMIVCDERNNTAQVIDNNELAVDIYLKPVRTAEFILISFYATRSDQDFTELI